MHFLQTVKNSKRKNLPIAEIYAVIKNKTSLKRERKFRRISTGEADLKKGAQLHYNQGPNSYLVNFSKKKRSGRIKIGELGNHR